MITNEKSLNINVNLSNIGEKKETNINIVDSKNTVKNNSIMKYFDFSSYYI